MAETAKILVFGQSNTAGSQLAAGEAAWPQLLAAALGERVQVSVRPFYAHAPGAAAYLDRELEKHAPDVVIVTLTPFAFLLPVVGPGVRRRYGDRVGDTWTWLESRLDRATRHGGPVRRSLNRGARRVSHAVFGAAPVASFDTVIAGYREAFSRLAREEQLQVLALQGPVRPLFARGTRAVAEAELLARYHSETRAMAAQLHIPYVNVVEAHPQAASLYMPDATHVTAEAQKLVAATVIAAVEEGRIALAHQARPAQAAQMDWR